MNYKSITARRGGHDGLNWIEDPTGEEIELRLIPVAPNDNRTHIIMLSDDDAEKLFNALGWV